MVVVVEASRDQCRDRSQAISTMCSDTKVKLTLKDSMYYFAPCSRKPGHVRLSVQSPTHSLSDLIICTFILVVLTLDYALKTCFTGLCLESNGMGLTWN